MDVVLVRSGDLSLTSFVRCYTRYMTTQVEIDYRERADTADSEIVFKRGEHQKICSVVILDDSKYEGKETLRLLLGSVSKNSRMGAINSTIITIWDQEDSKLSCVTFRYCFISLFCFLYLGIGPVKVVLFHCGSLC